MESSAAAGRRSPERSVRAASRRTRSATSPTSSSASPPRRRATRLAATLGVIAAVGASACSRRRYVVSFFPMLCIAAAYYYLNRADPDCGTTFTWVTQGDGPEERLDGGWAIIVADMPRDAEPGLRRRALHLPARRLGRGGHPTSGPCSPSDRLDHRHDLDLLGRRRALGAHAADPALDRGRHARAVRGRGAVKVYTGDPPGSIEPALSWFNPFDDRRSRALTGGVLLGDLHLLGLGLVGWRSTRRPRTRPRARASPPIVSTLILVGDLRARHDRGAGFRGHQAR